MAGRFKPRTVLNFNKKDRYLLYTSEFASAARAKRYAHPKQMSSLLMGFSGLGCLFSLGYAINLVRKGAWEYKFRILATLFLGSCFYKTNRRAGTLQQVISSISLRPDGKSLTIVCHFPGDICKNVPIKDIRILRQDDLARRLRLDDFLVDMRCVPVVYKGTSYNMFIEGTIHDQDVFKAVTDGQLIDTSESVNPDTLESLIVDI